MDAVRRRCFRALLRAQARRGTARHEPGEAGLPGYGFRMAYLDRVVWMYQVLEIFDEDCYRVGLIPEKPRVIDAGANVGVFTRYVLWRRPDARIVAVEPGPWNVACLRRNVADIAPDRVQIIEAALGRTRSTTRLGGAHSDCLRTGVADGQEVAVVPLSDILTEPTDLLKLDVEGAEMDALSGAGDGLRCVNRVVVEYHEFPGTADGLPEILMLLQRHGFGRYRVYGHREFGDGHEGLPVFCCLIEAWRTAASLMGVRASGGAARPDV